MAEDRKLRKESPSIAEDSKLREISSPATQIRHANGINSESFPPHPVDKTSSPFQTDANFPVCLIEEIGQPVAQDVPLSKEPAEPAEPAEPVELAKPVDPYKFKGSYKYDTHRFFRKARGPAPDISDQKAWARWAFSGVRPFSDLSDEERATLRREGSLNHFGTTTPPPVSDETKDWMNNLPDVDDEKFDEEFEAGIAKRKRYCECCDMDLAVKREKEQLEADAKRKF
ncbi:MAG: hypothetical protein M1832_002233 [Thelocarpon impressellum]|nr:MAG: hypothetical protein M1832_002233 [Thelocarpon impressellum]